MSKLLYNGPSFRVLHEEYAKRHTIDERAGSVAADSIVINAPVEKVWDILIAMDTWPTLNPLVSDVRLPSGVSVDATGTFKLNNFPVSFTFAVVDPYKELTWTGVSLWTKAIDRLWLERLTDTTTRLYLEESLAGLFVSRMSSSAQLHKQHMASLQSFKQAAER